MVFDFGLGLGGGGMAPRRRRQKRIVISENTWRFMKSVMNAALKGRVAGTIGHRRKKTFFR